MVFKKHQIWVLIVQSARIFISEPFNMCSHNLWNVTYWLVHICYRIAQKFYPKLTIYLSTVFWRPLYLYNKNILEYTQIAQNETESKIPYIESHSNVHIRFGHSHTLSRPKMVIFQGFWGSTLVILGQLLSTSLLFPDDGGSYVQLSISKVLWVILDSWKFLLLAENRTKWVILWVWRVTETKI